MLCVSQSSSSSETWRNHIVYGAAFVYGDIVMLRQKWPSLRLEAQHCLKKSPDALVLRFHFIGTVRASPNPEKQPQIKSTQYYVLYGI